MTAPSRRPMVAGNWKMNTTVREGLALASDMRDLIDNRDVDVVVLPPFTHLWPLNDVLAGTGIGIGAQDVFWEDAGAYTGEISPASLSGWTGFVLVGHSERRHILGEIDEQVNRKLRRALTHDLRVIVAVGETEAQRDAGQTAAIIERQLSIGFDGVAPEDFGRCILAYEPVWAIGTGRTATPQQAEEVCASCRSLLGARFGEERAGGLLILYGGSVTADNAASLFACADIDGALVGGASLRAREFATIVQAAAAASAVTP